VEAVGGEGLTPALQLAGEEHVAQLARRVRAPGPVAAVLGLQVVEVEQPAAVRVARRGDHAGA
jgi:hypothetical protein